MNNINQVIDLNKKYNTRHLRLAIE